MTGLALVVFCVRLLRMPLRTVLDWWIALLIVAVATTLGFWLAPPDAGWIAFGAMSLLIFAPLRLDRAAQRFSRAGRDRRALLYARLASILHPIGAIGGRPRALQALAHIRATGELDERVLDQLGAANDPVVSEWYRLMALNAAGEADGVRAALSVPSRRARMMQHGVGAIFVRAVAMTGSKAELVEAIEEAERRDLTLDDPERRAILALEACAGLGDVEGARTIGAGLEGRVPRGALDRALAAAQLGAGDELGARATMSKALARRDLDPAARRALERLRARFDRALEPSTDAPNPALDARATELLERLKREADAARALAPLSEGAPDDAWATWGLAAAILGWFCVVAAYGDTTDPAHLARMGGLLMPVEGAWGALRLFSSTFVHYGLAHLVFNLYALLSFGWFVESFYGRLRMLGVWIAATLTSGIGVVATSAGPHMLVGASGAIFGLGGALLSALLFRPELRRSRRGREELTLFGLIVGLQFVFDRLVPGVSGTAHVCGLLGGFLAGAVVLPRRRAAAR